MSEDLIVRTLDEDHRIRVVARGTLDASTSRDFADELGAVLDEGRPVHVDIDHLDFVDSTGVAAMMKAAQRARETLQQLTFGRGRGQVQVVLDTVRAEQFLMFAGDPAEETA